MRIASISIGAGILLAFGATGAMALGFGSVANSTVLGQPLSFSVPLRMDSEEFVSAECIVATIHSGDNRIAPTQVRVSLDAPRDGGTDRMLRITTSALIDEPVVTIDLGVGCPVRLSRKFVAFIDPPIVNLAQAAPPEPASAAPQPQAAASAPAAAPIVAAAPSPAESRTASAPAPRKAVRKPRPVARPGALTAGNAASAPRARATGEPAPRVAAAAPAPAGGARLKLEAAEPAARPASAPEPAASSAAAAEAAALAASQAEAAQARQAQEGQRMRALEESLAKLRSDADANRNSINTLQARLREAETRRYANAFVYGLIALVIALLAALVFALWWARSREKKQRADWWAASSEEAQPGAAPVMPAPEPMPEPPQSVPPDVYIEPARPAGGPVTWKPTLAIPELDKNEAPKRPVSAEELIDLEQQAEFFITLGQDESAIDLLVGHLNSAGGISPLPYLKLMEIHRRRGDMTAYERIREHFNQRFNAYAPPGDALPGPSRTLEEHADVMAQLQDAWPTPPRAMGLLESLLFKSGAGGDAAFDLAAYREVLFLHEVARDLYEREASSPAAAVDLLLPLDGPVAPTIINPLMSTMPVVPHPEIERPLAIDLDLGQPRDEEAEQAAARAERRKERYGDDDFLFGSGTGSGFGNDDIGKLGPRGRKGSK